MMALDDSINAAREVTKFHTSGVHTFQSGDFGFLGVADPDRVIFYRSPLRRQHVPWSSAPTRRGSRRRCRGSSALRPEEDT
jgi:L-asparaginase/Glu-tRNA(Gln) amidotransferase subunit D